MKMTSRYIFRLFGLVLFGFAFLQNLAAQDREIVRLFDISGPDFAITTNNQRTVHPVESIRRGRVTLERSAVVHTGADTFMDIILIPSGTVIRVAENTSLIYNGLNTAGNFEDFGLLYGRIRVVAGNRQRPIVVRGGGSVTRIMEGDFGVDHLVEASDWEFASQPHFQVNAFEGRAEFFPIGTGDQTSFLSAQALVVEEGESISPTGKWPTGGDIQEYWQVNTPEIWGQPRIVFSLVRDPFVTSNRGKNATLGIGLFLTVASAAALIITYPQFEIIGNRDLAENINNAAYIPLGMGLLTTLGGILYNPSRP